MHAYPVIVVGPARSATSTVARILHTQCGVCMGHNLRKASENNPDGYYEDLPIQRLNMALRRHIGYHLYRRRMTAVAEDRALCGAWGFKDPTACQVIQHVIKVFPEATYIRCVRPYEQVLASQLRIYNATKESIVAGIKRDEAMLDSHLPQCYCYEITTAELEDMEGVVSRLKKLCEAFHSRKTAAAEEA